MVGNILRVSLTEKRRGNGEMKEKEEEEEVEEKEREWNYEKRNSMRRRERNRKIKRSKLSRTRHRHARCSISSRVHAPYTQTRTKKENVITSFFLKNEFLKYPEQAHVRKYYLSCSYFSVHLGDSFFWGLASWALRLLTFVVTAHQISQLEERFHACCFVPRRRLWILSRCRAANYKLKRSWQGSSLYLSTVFTVSSDTSEIPLNLCVLRKTRQPRITSSEDSTSSVILERSIFSILSSSWSPWDLGWPPAYLPLIT